MLVMFALGVASFVWMLGLGLLVAAEKSVSWGPTLGRVVGSGFLLAAGLVVALH